MLLGAALVLAGCAAGTDAPGTAPGATGEAAPANDGLFQHPEDVVVDTCAVDEATSWPKATLTVTNQSSKASAYSVTVSFRSPGGATQFGEGFAAVTRLEPGQVTTVEAQGLAAVPEGAEYECVVTSAQRTEAV